MKPQIISAKTWPVPVRRLFPEAESYPLGLFYPPSPFKGWVLDENYEWQPPADKPYPEGFGTEGSLWFWDDLIEDWDEKNFTPEPE